jgi:valyl-tRNA synthetase
MNQRLQQVKAELEGLMGQFRLSEALKTLYSLIWDDFCSWYLEWIKPGFEQPMAATVYDQSVQYFTELLQLLHPYMPFITEEIYHLLQQRHTDLCELQLEPPTRVEATILEQGDLLKTTITALRDARNKHQLKPKDPIRLHIQSEVPAAYDRISSLLGKQVNAPGIAMTTTAVPNTISIVAGKDKFYIESDQPIDTAAQKAGLEKELAHLQGFLQSVDQKLSNERFVQNAKPEVIELERRKKADAEVKIRVIEESLAGLS